MPHTKRLACAALALPVLPLWAAAQQAGPLNRLAVAPAAALARPSLAYMKWPYFRASFGSPPSNTPQRNDEPPLQNGSPHIAGGSG